MKSSASVKQQTETIADYSVCYVTKRDTSGSPPVLNEGIRATLDRLLDSLAEKHDGFVTLIVQLQVNEKNCCTTLGNVLREMLADQRLNWGRVVTIYCFSGCMAKYLLNSGCPDGVVDKVIVTCREFVSRELTMWIEEQGGWEEFERHFAGPEKAPVPSWQGWHDLFRKGIDAVTSAVSVR